jgi:hypothetical protein
MPAVKVAAELAHTIPDAGVIVTEGVGATPGADNLMTQ